MEIRPTAGDTNYQSSLFVEINRDRIIEIQRRIQQGHSIKISSANDMLLVAGACASMAFHYQISYQREVGRLNVSNPEQLEANTANLVENIHAAIHCIDQMGQLILVEKYDSAFDPEMSGLVHLENGKVVFEMFLKVHPGIAY